MIKPSDLIRIKSRTLDRRIEVMTGLSVYECRTSARLTNDGKTYLRNLYESYTLGEVNVNDIMRNFSTIAEYFSGYSDKVEDRLYDEFYKIMNN